MVRNSVEEFSRERCVFRGVSVSILRKMVCAKERRNEDALSKT